MYLMVDSTRLSLSLVPMNFIVLFLAPTSALIFKMLNFYCFSVK
jgi:hypothetical protein